MSTPICACGDDDDMAPCTECGKPVCGHPECSIQLRTPIKGVADSFWVTTLCTKCQAKAKLVAEGKRVAA